MVYVSAKGWLPDLAGNSFPEYRQEFAWMEVIKSLFLPLRAQMAALK